MHPQNKNKSVAKLNFLKMSDTSKDRYAYFDPENDDASLNSGGVAYYEESGTSNQVNSPESKKQEHANTSELQSFSQNTLPSKLKPQHPKLNGTTMDKNLKMLSYSEPAADSNPNSFSSIFNKDHQEVFGVQRVFRKSIFLLVSHLLSFSLLLFVSLNLFSLPILPSVLIGTAYIVFTNIFYIIVADRSYVWISLLGQVTLILATHAFIGLSFDRITLIFTLLITIFTYFAYTELEKVQLSSRLFSIAHVTNQSIRILLTVVILVLALGVFNKALSQGSDNFVNQAFLDKPFVLNNLVIGKYKTLSLNRYFMKGRFYIEDNVLKSDLIRPANKINFVFSDFLTQNYKPSELLLSEDKSEEILANCNASVPGKCDQALTEEKTKNLEEWRKEAYPNLPYTLDTEITPARFEQITRQFYINEINKLNADDGSGAGSDFVDNLSRWLIVPRSYIIPAFVALFIYAVLAIIKPLLNLIAFLFTLLVWKILIWTGFAKINIEKVEAEIVSI